MYEITRQRRFNRKGLLLIGILLLLPVGAFYGCQVFQPKSDPAQLNDQMPLYRRIGILKSLGGVRTSSSGTHLLQLDDGDTILLKSLQINMDDPAYLGKAVELRGLLTHTTDGKQIMEVMNIDLVQEDAGLTAQEVNWKELESKDLGITIKYRDDLTMANENGAVVFSREFMPEPKVPEESALTQETLQDTQETTSVTAKIVHKFEISKAGLDEGETMYSVAGLKEGDEDMLSSGITKSRIGSGSYDSLKKTEGNATTYLVEAGKVIYTVKIDSGSDERTIEDQNLFYEMLSSLKITATADAVIDDDAVNNDSQEDTQEQNEEAKETTEEDEKTEAVTQEKAPATEQATTQEEVKTQEELTQEVKETEMDVSKLDGYEKLESESFKFSMMYPKSWYYSGSAGTDSSVIRHYEFGSEPLEEVPGDVAMDLISGAIPSGNSSIINGKEVTIVSTSEGVEVYAEGAGSRIYKFSGPSSTQNTLINMAVSIEE